MHPSFVSSLCITFAQIIIFYIRKVLSQEEECEENYVKNCFIEYGKFAFNDTVKARTNLTFFFVSLQGITKRCRLSWLTNRTLVFSMSPNAGGECGDGVSANEYSCANGAQKTLEI